MGVAYRVNTDLKKSPLRQGLRGEATYPMAVPAEAGAQ